MAYNRRDGWPTIAEMGGLDSPKYTNDLVEAKQIIQDYINKHIKNCYYQRINFYEKYIWIDYGSWSDFIYMYFSDEIAKREYFGEKLVLE